jgi:hypothetical protein
VTAFLNEHPNGAGRTFESQGKESSRTRYFLIFIILGVSLLWYPHSLGRVERLGYDFTIYYQGISNPGWLYAPWVTIFFEPLRVFSHDTAFLIFYTLSTLSFCGLVYHASRRSESLGILVCLFGFYPYLLSQELGNVTVILAYLCLTFSGSLLAMCIKPYCLAFVLYHSYNQFRRDR